MHLFSFELQFYAHAHSNVIDTALVHWLLVCHVICVCRFSFRLPHMQGWFPLSPRNKSKSATIALLVIFLITNMQLTIEKLWIQTSQILVLISRILYSYLLWLLCQSIFYCLMTCVLFSSMLSGLLSWKCNFFGMSYIYLL